MARQTHVLEDPEIRRSYLELVAKGEYTAVEAARKIGTYYRAVTRYAEAHEVFASDLKAASALGTRIRRLVRKGKDRKELKSEKEARERARKKQREDERRREAERRRLEDEEARRRQNAAGSELPDPLTPVVPGEPRKLPDGRELPPLSGQNYLHEQWYIIMNRTNENPSVVRTAQKVLGSMMIRPLADPFGGYVPPQIEAGEGAGAVDTRPKVVLMAPDNGSYAPGCGPVPEDEEGVA